MEIIRSKDNKIIADCFQRPKSKGCILYYKSNNPLFQTATELISRILKLSPKCFWKKNIKLATTTQK